MTKSPRSLAGAAPRPGGLPMFFLRLRPQRSSVSGCQSPSSNGYARHGWPVLPFSCRALGRYRGANVNFVRVWLRSGGFFEAHRANELVEIVDDALVEPVELGLLVGL